MHHSSCFFYFTINTDTFGIKYDVQMPGVMMLLFTLWCLEGREQSLVNSTLHNHHSDVLWYALNEGQQSSSAGAVTEHLWFAIPGAQYLSK